MYWHNYLEVARELAAQVGISFLVAFACALPAALLIHLWRRAIRPTDDLPRCSRCDYPLIGLPEPRCPECGTAFDPHAPTTPVEETRPSWSLLRRIRVTTGCVWGVGVWLILPFFRPSDRDTSLLAAIPLTLSYLLVAAPGCAVALRVFVGAAVGLLLTGAFSPHLSPLRDSNWAAYYIVPLLAALAAALYNLRGTGDRPSGPQP